MTMTARILVPDTGRANAYVPYDLRHVPKSFPGRRWDPDQKAWLIPIENVNALADALRAAGATVYVTTPQGEKWTGGGPRHGTSSTPAEGWADALFAAVGPDRQDAVYRALSRTLHPDHAGGDTRLQQELNAARERATFKVRGSA